ncbi:MAG: tRNA-binding protein [bacterium]
MPEEKIPISDFARLDIRTGEILSAEPVEGADRLYRVSVDIGEPAPRQTVAGIRRWYGAGELAGKKVIFLANLEPARIRGVESQGMILAAEGQDGISLLQPDRPLPNGCRVR